MRGTMARMVAMAAALAAAPAAPAASARDLPVPVDKGWQHAATGIILRATLLGLPRTKLNDSTNGEWDVAAQFNDPALATSATVYIFHPAVLSVPVWFDRAEYALIHRPSFGGTAPATAITAFAPPGSAVASGLRRVFVPARGPDKSTGVAVMPLGAWLVAVRLSSTTLDPSALDAQLGVLIAAIGWPSGVAPAKEAATPVAVCTTSLALHKAKLRKPDMSQALLGSLFAGVASKEAAKPDAAPPAPWCREGDQTPTYGMYRQQGTTNNYTLALGDAGRSANVFPGLSIPTMPSSGGFTVTLNDVDGSAATYPSFDQLPRPEQVIDELDHVRAISRTTGAGKNTTITLDSNLAR